LTGPDPAEVLHDQQDRPKQYIHRQ
jgi:hypothetical protein